MVEAARDADILIHEATFDEDMQEKAVSDRHSTVCEALRVALDARPAVTVLTHFSGRFERSLPDVGEAQRQVLSAAGVDGKPGHQVILAQDFMTLPLHGGNSDDDTTLRNVAAVMQPLHQLFAQEN